MRAPAARVVAARVMPAARVAPGSPTRAAGTRGRGAGRRGVASRAGPTVPVGLGRVAGALRLPRGVPSGLLVMLGFGAPAAIGLAAMLVCLARSVQLAGQARMERARAGAADCGEPPDGSSDGRASCCAAGRRWRVRARGG